MEHLILWGTLFGDRRYLGSVYLVVPGLKATPSCQSVFPSACWHSSIRKGRFVWLEVMVPSGWWQACEAAGHTESAARKQRA